jgi:plastocyanin
VRDFHSAVKNSGVIALSCSALWLCNCSSHEVEQQSISQQDSVAETRRNDAGSEIFGKIFLEGIIPAVAIRKMDADPACHVAGRKEIAAETIVVNPDSTLRNVFVYISKGLESRQFPVPQEPVVLDQRGCRFVPHVLGVQAGQALVLLNSDSTLHNVHAASRQNRPFNVGITQTLKQLTRTFDQAEVMIPLRCNVHPWMSAYVGVMAHPYFQVTGEDGEYHFGSLPAGEYVITAWHENFGVLEQSARLEHFEKKALHFKFVVHRQIN